MPAHSPKWANTPPSGPQEAPKLLCKSNENAKTFRQTGLRPPAGTPRRHMRVVLVDVTAAPGIRACTPVLFYGVPEYSSRAAQEGPKEAPKLLLKRTEKR